ncbi:DsrE family protein, partial [Acidithiobacillus thiooxidans]
IVVVAFGPGLKMLVANSPVAKTIAAMNAEGVEFDACHNTMLAMAKKLGHLPKLVPSAVIVPAGIVRIMQLESHGFDYVKP